MSGTEPVRFAFAGHAAVIDTADAELKATLADGLRHAQAGDEPTVASFSLIPLGNDGYEMIRDGVISSNQLKRQTLIWRVMSDAITALNDAVESQLVLHSAAVARDDAGLLLVGSSGSGKSTLAAWLTGNGYDYLTDEVVAVSTGGDAPDAHGLPRSIVLKRGSEFVWQDRLDEKQVEQLPEVMTGSVWLDPELLRPGGVRHSVTPRAVVFGQYVKDAPLEGEALTPAAATVELMRRLVNARNLPAGGLSMSAALARSVPAYSLTYPEASDAAAWIEREIPLTPG